MTSEEEQRLYRVLFEGSDEEVVARIVPKKGRLLLFDGKIKHASSQPKENKRIIINYGIKNDYKR